MKRDRERALLAMQELGWQAKRTPGKHPAWEFHRPDTGGFWDVVKVKQADLSMQWVADVAIRHDDAGHLKREIAEAKERWLQDRFPDIYSCPEKEL